LASPLVPFVGNLGKKKVIKKCVWLKNPVFNKWVLKSPKRNVKLNFLYGKGSLRITFSGQILPKLRERKELRN